MVSVNVPDAAIAPLPETNVWKLPKLEPVGVFKLVDPRPVNVTMNALPMPPKKVTELLPLPAQPAHVKIPDVEKVTGSAFALDVPSATTASSSALIRVALKKPAIFFPFSLASMGTSAPALNEGNYGFATHLNCHAAAAGQEQHWMNCCLLDLPNGSTAVGRQMSTAGIGLERRGKRTPKPTS